MQFPVKVQSANVRSPLFRIAPALFAALPPVKTQSENVAVALLRTCAPVSPELSLKVQSENVAAPVLTSTAPAGQFVKVCDENGTETDYRSFRTAWQTKDSSRRKNQVLAGEQGTASAAEHRDAEPQKFNRFRVIPFKKFEDGKKTEAKFDYPVLYLGLSRLFPLGESKDSSISTKRIAFKSEAHKQWFIGHYTSILSMQEGLTQVTFVNSGQDELFVLTKSFEAFNGIQMVFHRRLKGACVQRNERRIEEPQRGKVHILIIRCIEPMFCNQIQGIGVEYCISRQN